MTTSNVSRSLSTRPYCLSAIDQLPEPLLELAKNHLSESQSVERIFVVPPGTYIHGFRWELNPLQAIIFTKQGVLHLAASSNKGQPGEGVWVSVDDIFMIKLSLILLYGKLEIFGVQDEQIIKIEVEYNAVAHELLAPVLRGLIKKTWQKNPANFAHPLEHVDFSSLGSISFSFYNGLNNEAIQLDEQVLGYVYQPEIREPWLKIFYKKLFPQTVVALTDQQLILLQQDLKLHEHHEWIFTFIPLYRIASIKQAEYKSWKKISVQPLSEFPELNIEVIFEPMNTQKLHSMFKEEGIADQN